MRARSEGKEGKRKREFPSVTPIVWLLKNDNNSKFQFYVDSKDYQSCSIAKLHSSI